MATPTTNSETTATTNHAPARQPANHIRSFLSYLAVGLLAGILGAAFYAYFFHADAATTAIKTSKAVTIQEQSAVIDIVKHVSPSVVSITSNISQTDLFGQSQSGQAAGTGMIVTADGLIMTNKHVVADAQNLNVITSTGKQYKGTVLAQDPGNDIAFVKIEAKGLPPVELGDSSAVQVGQTVVAIGNALGQFQNSVTSGIISGRRQSISAGSEDGGASEPLSNLLQTDAAINPGNSGGPLVNIAGQVIGMNTAIAGEGAQNIGFAIPINDAKNDISTVESQGKIIRSYLGVRYVLLSDNIAGQIGISQTTGAYLQGSSSSPAVIDGGPADKAGLKDGDVIIKINDTKIDENNNLTTVIGKFKPGEKVTIIYIRNGKTSTTSATLIENPS